MSNDQCRSIWSEFLRFYIHIVIEGPTVVTIDVAFPFGEEVRDDWMEFTRDHPGPQIRIKPATQRPPLMLFASRALFDYLVIFLSAESCIIARTMISRSLPDPLDMNLRILDAVSLFHLCAADRENAEAWSEFMRRYAGRIKYFISGTLRQYWGTDRPDLTESGGVQESDLFQNTIVRMVENDCAAMKKFSGDSEDDLLAYLAVVARSAALDSFRRNRACKRRPAAAEIREHSPAPAVFPGSAAAPECDRHILAGELLSFARQTIRSHSGCASGRDQLVFDLHFFDGLSCSQIARCKGIKLSKAGVEKLLRRLVSRVQNLASSGKSEETLQ